MSPPPPVSAALSPTGAGDASLLPPVLVEAEQARLRRQAFGAVVLAAVIIGFSPILVRLSDVGPAAIGFWRMFFSLGPTALWALAEWREAKLHVRLRAQTAPRFTRRQGLLVVLAGLAFGADLILFHAGLARTSTANGVLIGNLYVIFVFALGWLCLGERPTRGLLVALGFAMAGAMLIVASSFTGSARAGSWIGDLLCVGGALAYAFYMLFVRILRREEPGQPALGGGMTALASSAVGMVACLGWALATGERILPAGLDGLMAVAALGAIVHAGGQGLTTFALGRLPAGLISMVMLLQILVGTALAALLFREFPPALVLVGGGLLVAGVVAARPRGS